ncbi:MAG: hypothetical protein EXR72_01715 [Myxococcales bacterium]|nr:hypothetical protein [Myxococcales bacterium]
MRILLVVLVAAALSSAPARAACNFPAPVRIRTVIPADNEAGVPTSIRVRVSYATGADAELQCGSKPAAPILRLAAPVPDGGIGDGGAPLDGGAPPDGGAGIAGQWVKATDVDPRAATAWEFRATQPLPPQTTFELLDTAPAKCPCSGGGCKATPLAVFARFATGAGPDKIKPVFSGLIATTCEHRTCPVQSADCCGPFDHLQYTFFDAKDAADQNFVGLHLHLRRDDQKTYDFTHPVGPLTLTDPVDSPGATKWDTTLTPGTWHAIARAFDSSGNEDENVVEVSFVWPLAKDPLCAPRPDAGAPDRPDLATPLVDSAAPDLAKGPEGGGCTCTVGRGRGVGFRGAAALLFSLALALARRRRAERDGRS